MFRKTEPTSKIIPLDSRSAVTIFKIIQLERQNPGEELTQTDLENNLAQAVWKLFDGLRIEASGRLGINEADLLLADVRVIGVRVDGHQVINPEGFRGRTMEFNLCISLVKRDRLPAEDNQGDIFEEGVVRAYLVSRKVELGELFYVESRDNSIYVFKVTPNISSYLTEFNWGKDDIYRAFTTEVGTDNELGEALYLRYTEGKASPKIMNKLDAAFYNTFGTFVNGLAMAIRNSKETGRNLRSEHDANKKGRNQVAIYINSFKLPPEVWGKRFTVGDRRVRFLQAPEVDLNDFISDNSNGVNSQLSRLAKQRIKWLMVR